MSENPQSAPAQRYTAELAGQIETKWQDRWEELGTFYADNPTGDLAGPLASHNPFFILDMFPYPSGKGLHVGHPLGYIATDTLARYRRMKGDNVLYTMGYDAFGLPAEQYAVQTGQHPAITTNQNIANMRRQLRRMGLSHDSRRSFATTDIEYVHWTQWIFLQVFNSWFDPEATAPDGSQGAARPITELIAKLESGEIRPEDGSDYNSLDRAAQAKIVDSFRLAYVSEAPVNWCPGLGTVLANEEVTADGRSERGNYPVFKRNLRQWMMRITAYGKRLSDDLDTINWPDKCAPCSATGSAAPRARPSALMCPARARPALPSTPWTSTRRAPTRCSARPSWSWPPSTRSLVAQSAATPATRLPSPCPPPGPRARRTRGRVAPPPRRRP